MSGSTTPTTDPASPTESYGAQDAAQDLDINSSLADLQTVEQRTVLDTIAQVRKCGLDGMISLPQLVVCGDQSAGKSSVRDPPYSAPLPTTNVAKI